MTLEASEEGQKKRGPKKKVFGGPLPIHLKLLAELCVKHSGPGSITYWDRILVDAQQQSQDLTHLIQEKKDTYSTFHKSRIRFLVDRQYRSAFKSYREMLEAKKREGFPAAPASKAATAARSQKGGSRVHQPRSKRGKASSSSSGVSTIPPLLPPPPLPRPIPNLAVYEKIPLNLRQYAVLVAESELTTGGSPCWDCLRRSKKQSSPLVTLFEQEDQAAVMTLEPDLQPYKDYVKAQMMKDFKLPHFYDYKFTVDGMRQFQRFLKDFNIKISSFSKEERNLPEIFKEFAFHLARLQFYKKIYTDEWVFLHRQPLCVALRTLLEKNQQVLITAQERPVFQSFSTKVLPMVEALERPRMNVEVCGTCASNLNKPQDVFAGRKVSRVDDAANALLKLSTRDDESSTEEGGNHDNSSRDNVPTVVNGTEGNQGVI
jgi:hypothetical protein